MDSTNSFWSLSKQMEWTAQTIFGLCQGKWNGQRELFLVSVKAKRMNSGNSFWFLSKQNIISTQGVIECMFPWLMKDNPHYAPSLPPARNHVNTYKYYTIAFSSDKLEIHTRSRTKHMGQQKNHAPAYIRVPDV